ncbi:MAG: hydrogenase expression/formation protein HypE, partial [Methanomicrobia archaeon]|nr:hydrogenase expression/formation protein HypE [Methanomicrobia archaeon]
MEERIKLSHGAGGELMDKLIKEKMLRYFADHNAAVPLSALDDAAVIDDIVFTTDSHTIQPLFFPGGDIGSLAVSGTVNDVLMKGARPLYLSLGFILEEGFLIHDLERILKSIQTTCAEAGVKVVTGDTKVVG